VRFNFNYTALMNFIEGEMNVSGGELYGLEYFVAHGLIFINSDGDLESLFEDWFRQIEEKELHDLELWYEDLNHYDY
jgi:hypothetical protein